MVFETKLITWVAHRLLTSSRLKNRLLPFGVKTLRVKPSISICFVVLDLQRISFSQHGGELTLGWFKEVWETEGARGKACVEKSLHITLPASLALTFGIHACLRAPFNASAVPKSLIKLMSNQRRECGVGERYDFRHQQPSASNTLMSQPISPNHPAVQADQEFVLAATKWRSYFKALWPVILE